MGAVLWVADQGSCSSSEALSRVESSNSFHSAMSMPSADELEEAVKATQRLVATLDPRQAMGAVSKQQEAAAAEPEVVVCKRTEAPHDRSAFTASIAIVARGVREKLYILAVVALGGSSGAAALGAGGASVGAVAGGAFGAVCGVVPALFTLGLSIPCGAVLGGISGLCMGAATGSTAGFLCGAKAGYRYSQGGPTASVIACRAATCRLAAAAVAPWRLLRSRKQVREAAASDTFESADEGEG